MNTCLSTVLTLWLLYSVSFVPTSSSIQNNACHGDSPPENFLKRNQNKKDTHEEKLTFTALFDKVLDSKLGRKTQQFVDELERKLEERQPNKNETNKENKLNEMHKLLSDVEKKQDELFAVFNEMKSDVQKIAACVEQTKEEKHVPKNCQEVLKMGNTVSGIYTIRPNHSSPAFDVRCEMDNRGGGWTYVLNRFEGSQDFFLNWEAYKQGFGRLAGEFWCGLEHLYELAGFEDNELLIELVDWDDEKVYAMYDNFKLGNELEGYPINVLGEYSGNAGDSLRYHVNAKFATKDRDVSTRCSNTFHGAWWYKNCWRSHLTGVYGAKESEEEEGMIWETYRGRNNSLRKARMLIRPRNREI